MTPVRPHLIAWAASCYQAFARPLDLQERQDQASPVTTVTTIQGSTTSSPSPSSSSTGQMSSQLPLILETVAPLAGVLIVMLVFICYLRRRREMRARGANRVSTNMRARATSDAQPLTSASTRSLTAEQLAGANSNRTGGQSGTANGSSSGAAGGGRTGSRRNRRERGLRRTESGHSVRTLPAYSKQAGDEEIVLVRQRSDETESDDEHDEFYARTSNLEPMPEIDVTDSSEPNAADQGEEGAGGAGVHARDSITRRGWGEAPSYVEATATPPATASSTTPLNSQSRLGVDGQTETMLGGLQRVGSSIFGLFRGPTTVQAGQRDRSGSATSSSSLLPLVRQNRSASIGSNLSLMPYPSRLSAVSTMTPQASTPSLVISSPLPHTAVRVSFDARDLPGGGLGMTREQMQFLGSSEAVHLVGVQIGEPPAGRRARRRSEALSDAGGDSDGHGRRSSDISARQGDSGTATPIPLEPPPTWDEAIQDIVTTSEPLMVTVPPPSASIPAVSIPLPLSPTSATASPHSASVSESRTGTPVHAVPPPSSSVSAH